MIAKEKLSKQVKQLSARALKGKIEKKVMKLWQTL